jgi:outer membrane receptor protein involved in Fe transport
MVAGHESKHRTASRCVIAALVLLAWAMPAPAADSAPSASAQDSVIPYPSSFFAAMGLDTAYDMVLRVPGFVFDDGSNLRGFAGAAGNVLIDGDRPTSKTDDLIGILRRVPISSVERIDLIRGGAPGIDMQGKTVVVNVIRKKAAGFKGVASLAVYKPLDVPFDPQVKLEGEWDDDGRILQGSLLAARFHDPSVPNGERTIFAPDGTVLDFSPTHSRPQTAFQYRATAAYETPLFGGKLKTNLLLEDQPAHSLSTDDFRVAGHDAEADRQDIGDAELGQHYDRALSSQWKIELIGLEHLNKTDTVSRFDTASDHQVFQANNHGGEALGRGILHWRPSNALTVDTGGEFAYNWLQTHTLFTDNGVPVAVPAGSVFVSEKRGEVFATSVWQARKTLTIEADIKVEASTIASSGDVILSKTLVFPKPRLLATYSPDDEDQLRLRAEREVGQLDFMDFAANATLNSTGVTAGNPNLSPQRDWAFEVAYDRHFWKDGVVSLTLRRLLLTDVVDRVPVFSPAGPFDEPGNIGAGRENDIVASFSLPMARLGIDNATLRGLATWRFSRVKDPTTGESREISMSGTQHPLDAEVHFAQDFPKWNVSWGVDSTLPFLLRNFRFNEIDRTVNGNEDTVYVDYKPRPDITLRMQTDLERVTYDSSRQVFAGPRGSNPLLFTDVQRRHAGIITFFRLRKTFG